MPQNFPMTYEGTTTVSSNDQSADHLLGKIAAGTHVTVVETNDGANETLTINADHTLDSYTVGTLPSASPAAQLIYVTDETGGAVPAFSDGTDWRRVTDRAIVS